MTTSTYGLTVRGNQSQLIIGDGNPVLTQKYKGPLKITHTLKSINVQRWTMGYGYCVVTYPAPIATDLPPLVFAVPTSAANNTGLGFFYHTGEPGRWTGFSVVITPRLFGGNSSTSVGFDSGWTYRVCAFGDPGLNLSDDEYGLRVYGKNNEPVFDSRWPIVPFRGLLGAWQHDSFTRSYNLRYYWGRRTVRGDADEVLVKGKHVWGASNDTLGFLLSGLGCISLRHDIGDFNYTNTAVVTMGFLDSKRSHIWAVAYEGLSQHPAGDVTDMNGWRLLTADFAYV